MDRSQIINDAYDAHRSGLGDMGFVLLVMIRRLTDYLGQSATIRVVNLTGLDTDYRRTNALRLEKRGEAVFGMLRIDLDGGRDHMHVSVSAAPEGRHALLTFGEVVAPVDIHAGESIDVYLYRVWTHLLRLGCEAGAEALRRDGPPKND